ncbi:helix-turn-helix transcriptional regulator [Halobacterium sp. CBA1126]|uniref:helix-turn-helix transcriptional regulator n=1 Tax=Halobacterium TaxID=2239 RepID=UPI001320C50F|nr:helix-turn-helix domain-containing protein [Halobacterium sp. CBA1126]
MNNDVRERREAEGLSQGELGDAVGVSRQTINAIERDRYDPSLELAFALADFFDCRVEDLFDPDG